ncbi:sigma-54 interacting regulator [Desulfonema ishimotonii]|uniref:Sigma-54 interacting regulator n=2 Tax=Desulfonema ishimotonii TaxID=45657 RepID=A0A401FQ63_9BACT|nr:sigma-54 interacting regulator [Desulfonema ishimotonii]
MKTSRYHVSFYIIIPLIFAGYAVLASISTYRLTQYCLKHDLDPGSLLLWALIVISIIGSVCGLIIVWILLKPVSNFIRNAQSVMPLKEAEEDAKDPIEKWGHVFNEITSRLSIVETKELFPEIIAESEIMRAVLSQIKKVAPTDSTVLIIGESGTGKELVATSIYKQSLRNDKPFIKLNCVAVPDGLWESELFGHEKGAFTGATSRKIGRFELANSGTLFLDEIGDMPLETQAKMLRVLQEREFERVGGTRSIKVDVRFIAATNKDLKKMVEVKKFREDLFFRLNVIRLDIPPLRDRRDDIAVLVNHFCRQREIEVSPIALQMLMENSSWPGNVRELQNIVERAAVMSENDIIEPRHLPENIIGSGIAPLLAVSSAGESPDAGDDNSPPSLDDQLSGIERAMIIEALRKSEGVQVKAAGLLRIKQRSLWHRIKKHNINAKAFKKNN